VKISRNLLAASIVSAFALFSASGSHAATVTFSFDNPIPSPFLLDPDSPGIVGGNCVGSGSGAPCLGVNSRGAAILSIVSGTFSVLSFWFQLLGEDDNLLVTTDKGTLTLFEADFDHNDGGQNLDVSSQPLLQNISYVSFLTDRGNARIDDIAAVHMAPVPLPASAAFLLGGLGVLAIFRRRKYVA
jgi:hypothetical protein